MDSVKCFIRILLISFLSHFSISADTITPHHFIQDNNDDVIVSGGNIFALGFFSPGSSRNRYVGIWYYQIPGKTVVWVANRDNPIRDNSGVVRIDGQGNLALFQKNQTVPVWSTNISIAGTRNSFAQILDSGNLVLLQNGTRKAVLWQSFSHPTNTWLSFMKIGFNLRTGLNQSYTSWKSPDDPGVGNYSFRMNPGVSPQMVLYKGSVPVWRSGTWTGKKWNGVPEMTQNFLFRDSFVNTDDEVSFSSDVRNASVIERAVVNETGVVQRIIWSNEARRWISLTFPKEQCDLYGHCGSNGYCNPYLGDFECTCFPGFEPKSHDAWSVRDGTAGCVRKRNISLCGNGEGFIKFPHARVPDTSRVPASVDMSIGLKQCAEKCLRNCSCMAYATANSDTNGGVGCLTWHGDLVDARAYTEAGQDLYIRVDKHELARYTKKDLVQKTGVLAVIIISSAMAFLILAALLRCLVLRQRREARTRKNKNILCSITRSPLYFEDSLGENETDESRRNGDLPFFDLSTIAAATNNFSSDNKLGQGGFGPVYKGVLVNGKEIAVKRLSKHSGQGVEEFKNEILLIAKLQHRNLVRMLGCCVEGDEKMLIYEFLPNKSLDSIIFDETKRSLLDWKKRFEIICGIARGMLYLHQDSRLTVIHRDLKASNVLLDATMNPKISDFGMARIFREDQIEGDTKRVVGTYGYMSPEYAMQGHFSMKSDVYSFGVLLLEIITGKKISSYFPNDMSLNLVGHVWDLWKEGKSMEVVDSTLGDSYSTEDMLKCIQIGLLCVQEHATHRPTMSAVVSMLSNEATVPSPEQPAFIEQKTHTVDEIPSSEGATSVNLVSITMLEGR